jgi:putative two-component system response regulator
MSRVLIVDDDAAVVEVLRRYLQDSVDEVRGVTDSRQVEHTFIEFEPDIVVLDLHMPQPDGFEVLRRLRGARVSLGFLPVIALTGDTSHVARNSALILGADEFVTKPVDRQ